MKSWVIEKHGGFDGLAGVAQPDPQPGAREVLIRVRAVSLNYRDLLTVRRGGGGNLPPPFVPCSDGAGEIVAVGAEVQQWKPGDRVAGIFFPNGWRGHLIFGITKARWVAPLRGCSANVSSSRSPPWLRCPPIFPGRKRPACPAAPRSRLWQALFTRGGLESGAHTCSCSARAVFR